MRALFRADSSVEIGSGHIRRCLALAAALVRKGVSCVFVVRAFPGNASELVRAAGHRLVELLPRMLPETDAAETSAAVAAFSPFDLLVVDHYALGRRWEESMRPLARRLAVIDDLADREHDCDVLIDVAPGEDRAALYDALIPPHATALLGLRYALLRPEFGSARGTLRARAGTIQRILISFGAIDRDNYSQAALRAVRQSCGQDVDIDIVLGGDAPHRSTLSKSTRSDPHARLHIDTSDMATLMAAADLAIGAGGTTSWERACLGLPAIVTMIADNQRDTVRALAEAGAAVSVPGGQGYEARLGAAIASLRSDPSRLTAMSAAAARLVDGKGANRIATILLRPEVVLRAVTAADCRDLWRWRNEPHVRQGSTNTDPIAWETHRAWFDAALKNPDRRLLIGAVADEALGVLRFDVAGDQAVISIYLTPQGHGRGVGPELLMQGEAWLRRDRPEVARIKAQIRADNEASIAAFAAARYRRKGDYHVRELTYDAAKTH